MSSVQLWSADVDHGRTVIVATWEKHLPGTSRPGYLTQVMPRYEGDPVLGWPILRTVHRSEAAAIRDAERLAGQYECRACRAGTCPCDVCGPDPIADRPCVACGH